MIKVKNCMCKQYRNIKEFVCTNIKEFVCTNIVEFVKVCRRETDAVAAIMRPLYSLLYTAPTTPPHTPTPTPPTPPTTASAQKCTQSQTVYKNACTERVHKSPDKWTRLHNAEISCVNCITGCALSGVNCIAGCAMHCRCSTLCALRGCVRRGLM